MNRSQQLNNITKENDTNNSQDITQNSVSRNINSNLEQQNKGLRSLQHKMIESIDKG